MYRYIHRRSVVFFSRMENLVKAVFSNGRWENPKEFDTWKIPGKLEFLKMRLKDTDKSEIPSDPKVPYIKIYYKTLMPVDTSEIS